MMYPYFGSGVGWYIGNPLAFYIHAVTLTHSPNLGRKNTNIHICLFEEKRFVLYVQIYKMIIRYYASFWACFGSVNCSYIFLAASSLASPFFSNISSSSTI